MLLRFSKMHGLGNDFMVVDLLTQRFKFFPELIRRLANRHTGVGFDQLLIVEPPKDPQTDFFYRIFNADGNEVEQCGNGARCVAKFVTEHRLISKNHMVLQTVKGNLQAQMLDREHVKVWFNPPTFEPPAIPFVTEKRQDVYQLNINQQSIEFSALALGNPHAVVLVNKVEDAPVATVGPKIEKHATFPAGVNVGFMEVVNRQEIKLRVFERGVGETLACGSGACAAAVAGIKRGMLDPEVTVHLRGGDLLVNWQGEETDIMMTGPAVWVYEGKIRL